ncbi:MAG: lipid IV(A) 3-deoxy-D-manno-octulosonic acid transferase [Pseudomonadota bacterium]
MAGLFYTLAIHALLPWAVLHLLWRARRQPEYLRHWTERFGLHAGTPPPAPLIWIHAVSVGETRAAQPLVAALRARHPDHRILFTHMTPTGRATSEALFGDTVERIYLPYDTPWAMRRFLEHFRPTLGLIMETELWPNLIAACRTQGIPLLLVNARLSEKSARRYRRFPALARTALADLSAIAAIAAEDAQRLRSLGAGEVAVFGSMKFDIDPPVAQLELGRTFRARIGARSVFLCASTREGEEALLLDAWQKKVSAGGTAAQSAAPLLVLVPRHPQRFDAVAKLVETRGLALQRRSDDAPLAAATQVWLGDSMGEMFAYYAMTDVACIGGSLLDFGSQNLIEPCAVGVPVIVGPSTFNFAEVARAALEAGAACQVPDAETAVAEALGLLEDAARRQAMAVAGREFSARHRGATQRTLALIERFMPPPGRP